MVPLGKADLILALEALEGLRESAKAGKQTKILINEYFLPFIGSLPREEIKKRLMAERGDFVFVDASKICKEKLGNEVVCAMYLLGFAICKKMIPLKAESVLRALEENIPKKYLDLNIKAFKLGYE